MKTASQSRSSRGLLEPGHGQAYPSREAIVYVEPLLLSQDDLEHHVIEEMGQCEAEGFRISKDCDLFLARRVAASISKRYSIRFAKLYDQLKADVPLPSGSRKGQDEPKDAA